MRAGHLAAIGELLSASFLVVAIVSSQGLIFSVRDFESGAGLVSQFPLYYWLGMAALILTCAILFTRVPDYSAYVYLSTLILVGAYLFGFKIAIQKIPWASWTFAPFFTVDSVLKTAHLSLSTVSNFYYYYQLPGNVLLNADIIAMTGLPARYLLSIMPFVWIFSFPIIGFSGCKRAGLSLKESFLATLLVSSVWIFGFAGYEYPRLPAMLLFLTIVSLILAPHLSRTSLVLITISFATIVITHSVTALATFSGLTFLMLYRRKFMVIVVTSSLLAAWYTYVSTGYLAPTLSTLGEGGVPLFNHFQNLLSGTGQVSLLLERYLTLYDMAPFVVTIIAVIVLLVLRRIDRTEERRNVSIVAFSAGVGAILPVFVSGESIFRLFLMVVLPLAIAFIFLIRSNRILLITGVIVILSLVVLSPIVNYSTDPYQYFAPEVGVVGFYSIHQVGQPYYYLFDEGDMFYFNHSMNALNWGRYEPGIAYNYSGMALTPVVITSYLSSTIFGAPYSSWPSSTSAHRADKVYGNRFSQVFLNWNLTN
ncbi:MAG: hypothetical protein JRN62_10395 [Nitrososphaerota archaeon]|nr:hypothetical protein [Nitrososphaerota archaeon]